MTTPTATVGIHRLRPCRACGKPMERVGDSGRRYACQTDGCSKKGMDYVAGGPSLGVEIRVSSSEDEP